LTTIVTFGNCQARGIASLLELLLPDSYPRPTFLSNNARTGRMEATEKILETLNGADLVVFQPLRRDHGELSAANVRAALDDSVTLLAFPYIFNSGVAGFCSAPNALSDRSYGKIFGERPLFERLEAGASSDELVEEYLQGELDLQVPQRFDECMRKIAERERTNEIRVHDFILENHGEIRLFLMHNHPTTALYAEILRQLKELASLPIDVESLTARAREEDNVAGHAYDADALTISPRDCADLGYTFGADPNWSEVGTKLIRVIAAEWDRNRSRVGIGG
jgi:hypothetical protein